MAIAQVGADYNCWCKRHMLFLFWFFFSHQPPIWIAQNQFVSSLSLSFEDSLMDQKGWYSLQCIYPSHQIHNTVIEYGWSSKRAQRIWKYIDAVLLECVYVCVCMNDEINNRRQTTNFGRFYFFFRSFLKINVIRSYWTAISWAYK